MDAVPYDQSDPRAALSTAVAPPPGVPRPATYRELHHAQPDETHAHGSRTWWMRSQAMVVAQSEVVAGESIRVQSAAEHALLVLDGARARVAARGDSDGADQHVDEDAVVIVPPGPSVVHVAAPGTIVRVFAAALEPALAARCPNDGDYDVPDHNVAGYAPWPAATDGERVRVYPIAAYPTEPGRLGRIFRCATVMVNVFEPHVEPRDPTKLSPHHHDDFEQVSLQVAGDYVHHMRVTWTPDRTTWRDDEHQQCAGPAIVVIPPPIVHTSEAVGHMRHFLIDVFAPPRVDFSERPGWVLNADEYPMP